MSFPLCPQAKDKTAISSTAGTKEVPKNHCKWKKWDELTDTKYLGRGLLNTSRWYCLAEYFAKKIKVRASEAIHKLHLFNREKKDIWKEDKFGFFSFETMLCLEMMLKDLEMKDKASF